MPFDLLGGNDDDLLNDVSDFNFECGQDQGLEGIIEHQCESPVNTDPNP